MTAAGKARALSHKYQETTRTAYSLLLIRRVWRKASPSRLDRFFDKLETRFARNKLKAEIVVATGKRQIHRLNLVKKHGHPSDTLSKIPEQVTADSMIRSILWQRQHPAIKIQYASSALLPKLNELKTTGGMFSSGGVVRESDTPVIHPEVDDIDVLVRQWVTDHNEQLNPKNQRAENWRCRKSSWTVISPVPVPVPVPVYWVDV